MDPQELGTQPVFSGGQPVNQTPTGGQPAPSAGLTTAAAASVDPLSPASQPAPPPVASEFSDPTQTPAQPAAPSPFASVRDSLREQYGVDLSHLPDDRSALQYLVTQAMQGRQYQDAASRYMQHAGDFESYLAQRQAAQQQAAPAPVAKPWVNPHEWKPEWNRFLRLDPATGQPGPGSDPQMAAKYMAYNGWRQQWADKLLDNPTEALRPLIDEFAASKANEMVQQHLGGYQEQVWSQNFVNTNSSWLHQRDANGNVQMVTNPRTGQPAPRLSALGSRFRDHVVSAHQAGVTNLEQQQQFARALLERDLLSARYRMQQSGQQAAPANQAAPAPQAPVRMADYNGTMPPATPNAAGQVSQNPGLSLRDQLRNAFKQNGIGDNDILLPRMAA